MPLAYSLSFVPLGSQPHNGHAMQTLNHHYPFLWKLIVFTDYKHENICIAWNNYRAGFATDPLPYLGPRPYPHSYPYTHTRPHHRNELEQHVYYHLRIFCFSYHHILPTLALLYSHHENNEIVCNAVEVSLYFKIWCVPFFNLCWGSRN